jgi:hypothetical protein
MSHIWRSQHPLTSRVSGTREIREQSSSLRLTKSRVASTRGEKSISPLGGSGKKGAKVGPLNS